MKRQERSLVNPSGPPREAAGWDLCPLWYASIHTRVPQTSQCVRAKSLQQGPTLWHPVDHSPPGSSVPGILRARTLEWAAMPSSRGSSQPWDRTHVSCGSRIAAGFLITELPGKPINKLQSATQLWVNFTHLKGCKKQTRIFGRGHCGLIAPNIYYLVFGTKSLLIPVLF